MKFRLIRLGLLTLVMASSAHAVEILRWERLPLAVPLTVGQERIVFVEHNVRVGIPASISDRLRVQSAGGAIYLRASKPIEPTRLQLQDVDSGALILLDIDAMPAKEGEPKLEPVRIVEGNTAPPHYGQQLDSETKTPITEPDRPTQHETPVAVVLTRYAAQNLYAPLRTVEPVPGIMRVNLRRNLPLDTLLPTLPVQATALVSWRLEDQWVTAVRLTHTGSGWIQLDPRTLQGDFLTATFQHAALGPRGSPEDTTVLYLVTRKHGLPQSLLPAIQRVDPAVHLPASTPPTTEVNHAQ
ncbi:TIGR03749 family integrating conjugative element protein [Dickeya dianthicola]|uniref:TIGR03749 family integrating conjugative element protein n=1 Tax=Dickeya dianthicola TaxID=204039 RepID=UPI00136C49EE|nr:TIGR03749 family integrating conjugative element protein [Dickeya dianthicola]MCI4239470.1 TIGR03749 family integrating conjugative element protein [Dickeya dianthicola]MCI4257346.1 TIGR03749 family integrating conjugative element protein [Dickeya dianthicola]MZG22523.1 TIGR03749 family integrating conjugative element protein [Dickeya dianthicola]MZI91004.1 TIGR03749 family integrating conjugative element protein [Dickeya dianthicola]